MTRAEFTPIAITPDSIDELIALTEKNPLPLFDLTDIFYLHKAFMERRTSHLTPSMAFWYMTDFLLECGRIIGIREERQRRKHGVQRTEIPAK